MTRTSHLRRLPAFLLTAISLIVLSFSASALTAPSSSPEVKEKSVVSPFASMDAQAFLELTPKKYRELTGEKMSLTQKVALKIAQSKVKKAIKNHEQVDISQSADLVDTSDFNIGGFVLGLIIPIVGVVIAYLIGDPSVIKWAWVGFGILAFILLLVWIL